MREVELRHFIDDPVFSHFSRYLYYYWFLLEVGLARVEEEETGSVKWEVVRREHGG